MNDEEFEMFIEQVPLNQEGDVKYTEFMAQFDTKQGAKSLWDGKSIVEKNSYAVKTRNVEAKDSTERLEFVNCSKVFRERKKCSIEMCKTCICVFFLFCRSTDDLHATLRDIVRNDMHKLESEFRDLDEYNSGRLTQEMMYQLLLKYSQVFTSLCFNTLYTYKNLSQDEN